MAAEVPKGARESDAQKEGGLAMEMEPGTLYQGTKILAYFRDKPLEQVEALLASGLLADLRDATFTQPVDRDAVRGLLGLEPLDPPLLVELGTVLVPATTAFVVHDKFVRNAGMGAVPKISFVGSVFREWFPGKTEEPVPETELRYHELMKPSVDGSILQELGDKAETMLSQVYWLMASQPNGQEGVLSASGRANIFYTNGCAVRVSWVGGGWSVEAYSTENLSKWGAGHRVFSRNS